MEINLERLAEQVRELIVEFGMNIVAAPNDQFFQPAFDAQIARLIERAEIAGEEPAIAVETRLGRCLVGEIPEHQRGAAPRDLAHRSRRNRPVGVLAIDDLHFIGWTAAPAGGRPNCVIYLSYQTCQWK